MKNPYYSSWVSSQPAMYLAGAADPGRAWLERPLGAILGVFHTFPVGMQASAYAREGKGRRQICPMGRRLEPPELDKALTLGWPEGVCEAGLTEQWNMQKQRAGRATCRRIKPQFETQSKNYMNIKSLVY